MAQVTMRVWRGDASGPESPSVGARSGARSGEDWELAMERQSKLG